MDMLLSKGDAPETTLAAFVQAQAVISRQCPQCMLLGFQNSIGPQISGNCQLCHLPTPSLSNQVNIGWDAFVASRNLGKPVRTQSSRLKLFGAALRLLQGSAGCKRADDKSESLR